MPRNYLCTQPEACSGMKCPHVIKTGQLKRSRNKKHGVKFREKKISRIKENNVKDNQNERKKMIVIGQFKKNNFY